jgi:molybdate transport system substrate-binding protein
VSSIWERRLGAVRVAAIALVLALLVVARLRSPTHSGPVPVLNVAAASDLRFALDELTGVYSKQVAALRVTYGSSGTLYAQILNGAPYDLFLSADVDYPKQLVEHGKAVATSEFTYAIGKLVIWVPASSPLDVDGLGLKVVSDPRVAHIAIANPAHAPYGRAAQTALQRLRLYDGVKSKLVLGENVSQAMQFVQSGAADVGIVALSLAVAPTAKGTGRFAIVPIDLYPALEQGGVIIASPTVPPEPARAFRSYLMTSGARAILAKYGFSNPGA